MMHEEEDDINRITNTAAWTNLWLNKALSHRGVSCWVTDKVATVQTLSGDSNRQPCSLKPTAVTRPGWHRPRWAAVTAGMLLSSGSHWLITGQPACTYYHLTIQHLVGAGNGNSLRTPVNKLSSYIKVYIIQLCERKRFSHIQFLPLQ